MKKVVFSAALVAAIALTSCGGGAKADGQKLCDCMKGAMKDMSKVGECMTMATEMEKKYSGNEEAKKEIEAVMNDCEKELKPE